MPETAAYGTLPSTVGDRPAEESSCCCALCPACSHDPLAFPGWCIVFFTSRMLVGFARFTPARQPCSDLRQPAPAPHRPPFIGNCAHSSAPDSRPTAPFSKMAAAPANGGAVPPAAPAAATAELQPYLDVALAAAREAGAVIAAAWNAPKQIDTKSGDADLVTGGGQSPSCSMLPGPLSAASRCAQKGCVKYVCMHVKNAVGHSLAG